MVTRGAGQSVPRAAPRPPLKRPPLLSPGDRVALFSPGAHGGRFPAKWPRQAARLLEEWGLRPLPPPRATRTHLYLAGPDRERAEEFQSLYCDPEIKALFATRGGYGTARMLSWLDAGAIAAAAPKAVVGMSDVSALFAFLHAVAGVGSLHGPCLAAPGLFDSPRREDNQADLRAVLFNSAPPPDYPCTLLHLPHPGGAPARGPLVGGNLTVLAAALGGPWALNTQGTVLFLEEVNEAPYRVDRALTQFKQAGRFEGLAALVFGHMTGCDGEPPGLLQQMLRDLFAGVPFPVAMGLPAGHGDFNRTLPLGCMAELKPLPDAGADSACLSVT